MWPGVLKLLVLLTFLLHPSRCTQGKVNYREKEKEVLDNILGGYDARIRPSGENATDEPTNVMVNIFLRSISKINDYNMEYSVQLTFREQWLDERLRFNDFGGRLKYLTLTDASRVWMPDLFFSNEKEGHFHNIIMPNVYIRIFPNGSVLYSIRISLTLSCPMNLKLYPLDRQVCSLRMASYGWTTDDLVFLWKEGDPVQVVKNLHLPRFTLEKFFTDYCNSKTNTGEYSCLKVDLLFKREFSYYLIQIYIPCCMLVIVSWVSFWLDQSAVPARVSLGVTTLLTMATQTSGINASLPPVSYTKAIDIWTGVCLTFVFGALLEFALVNYASRSDMHSDNIEKKYPPSETEQSTSMDLPSDQVEPDNSSNFAMKPLVRQPEDTMSVDRMQHCELHMQPRKKNCCRSWLSKFPTRSKRIDVISRIFFPIVFAFFNLAYWSTYLIIVRAHATIITNNRNHRTTVVASIINTISINTLTCNSSRSNTCSNSRRHRRPRHLASINRYHRTTTTTTRGTNTIRVITYIKHSNRDLPRSRRCTTSKVAVDARQGVRGTRAKALRDPHPRPRLHPRPRPPRLAGLRPHRPRRLFARPHHKMSAVFNDFRFLVPRGAVGVFYRDVGSPAERKVPPGLTSSRVSLSPSCLSCSIWDIGPPICSQVTKIFICKSKTIAYRDHYWIGLIA